MVYFITVLTINSIVDLHCNANQVVNSDEANDHIADFTGDFSDLDVVLHGFVFSPKHLTHFKIPKSKQEVRLVVQAVGHVITNDKYKEKVVEVIIAEICWALWVEFRIIITPVVPICQYIVGYHKEWTDEEESSNSVNIGELAMSVSIYKYS
jgi:hypothetical protein